MYKEQIFKSDKELPLEIKLQVLSFLRINYPDGFIDTNENRDWINNPDDKSIHIAITTKSNILISYSAVVSKQLKHMNESYNCRGITGVMTYPSFRGRGFGKRVVEIATKLIKDSDADIGMFHCLKTLKNFYVNCGWIPMEKSTTLIGDVSNPKKSEELMFMLYLSEKAILKRKDFETHPIYFGKNTW